MNSILTWAHRHSIPHAAIADLLHILGMAAPPLQQAGAGGEAAVQAAVRLEAARRGVRLWRNNSGVAMNDRGQPIRFGVANESAAINKVFKSSDLIGIGPDGKFWAIECKKPDWVYRDSDQRAVAQAAFLKLIVAAGGVGKFVRGVEDLP